MADAMRTVTVRDLRNRGGEVLDQVAAGEHLTVTRDGRPVAELRPVRRPGLSAATLVERWRRLPRVDPRRLRQDLDDVLDQRL
jgi:prevent-host-death family protein